MSIDALGLEPVVPGRHIDPNRTGEQSIRFVPGFVWMVSFCLLLVALLGSLILPQLQIPDEKHNADMVLMAQEGEWLRDGWPGLDERRIDPAIIAASLSLGPRERALRENRAGQHPPFFFLTAAATSSLATVAVEEPGLSLRLWTYRLISVIATALLPIVYYLIASELTANRWVRVASAIFPLAVPGITLRDGSMVNTDALLMFLASASILMGIRVAKNDLSIKTAVLLGTATGLACLTKGHALFLIPTLVIAYLVPIVRDRHVTREWVTSILVSGGITFLVGGWWWIRNLVVYGMLQPVRTPDQVDGVPTLEMIDWLTEASRRLVGSFWGGGFAMAGRAYMPLFWVLTIGLIVACVVGWRRSPDRKMAFISSSYALLLVASVLVSSWYFSSARGRVVAVQGRYFFPGLAGVAPLVLLGAARFGRRANRWLPTAFAIGSFAMTLLATNYMLDRFWASPGSGFSDQWAAVVAASPLTEAVSTGILILCAVSLIAVVIWAILIGMQSEETNPKRPSQPRPANVESIASGNPT
jgi:4-amino-4-deoxy-L-arabinose transferase-like glycosyltransferase